uniref:PGG domain-containing protein n=1 Tax=Oryza glaberrima TaxID=4538 RepID=I1Q1P9_ORYGL
MTEGVSNMQPHRGSESIAAADGGHPQSEIVESNSLPTPEPRDDVQMADETADIESQQDSKMVEIKDQDSGNSSSRLASFNSHEARIRIDFEFLWRLRKYLLLLAVLAVSVTYNAGLSPPGGFWADDSPVHHAGDPLLPSKFFQRYEAFFYCNATAFAASLVLIILLLSRGVANQHLWLRAMQVTMILDLFSLMAAYAAGSCRALKSSAYILVLVLSVFLYVGIHILVFIRVVPKGLKEGVQTFMHKTVQKLQRMLKRVLTICHPPKKQRSNQNEKEEIEEARKFILMLSTFAATITYQAGMSPPGGFWAENNHGYRPATFVLRRHNLRRFNIFTCSNATSFVASLVTIILLLSTELSRHGIRTQALFVCVIAELFGLIFAYAAGSCRDVATSLSVIFIIVVVLICALILVMFFQSRTVTIWIDNALRPRFDHFLEMLSWPRENRLSDGNREGPLSSSRQDTDHGNLGDQSTEDVKSAPINDLESIKDSIPNMANQLHDQKDNLAIATVHSSSADVPSTKGPLPEQVLSEPISALGDRTVSADVPDTEHNIAKRQRDREEQTQELSGHHDSSEADGEVRKSEDGIVSNNDGTRDKGRISGDSEKNPDDVRLKKSRTYLLLLAILAVSLTYQAGINPPGGFWTSNTPNHSPGDPILEDNYHKRYLAFFYFNAIAFLASLVMLIMLLNRKMSNKVIKRRALQTAMITDLLALLGAFVVGSCREKTKSIYISVVIFFVVVAYTFLHVLASKYAVPEQWKQLFKRRQDVLQEHHVDNDAKDAHEKDLERRRNLLFILAILTATVTYQAGLNPPGGIWPDGSGKPGNPVLQDSHPKRYDVFYYSNALSFVSSVAVIILLVNRESCEHGIKSYALRICLIAGLLGLPIAYSAGSFRKVKSIGYLIIITAAVLICLLIQVLVLSSTNDALEPPARSGRWLQKFFGLADSQKSLASPGQSKNESDKSDPLINEKKEKRHKYLMLLAILAASIAYQAGLNPPGGFWSEDSRDGYKAGNPLLKDIHSRRYMVFYVSNSISFMASIAVIMLLLSKSVRKNKVPLQALFLIMILDLLALMTAYAAGSCRKIRKVKENDCSCVDFLHFSRTLSSSAIPNARGSLRVAKRKGTWDGIDAHNSHQDIAKYCEWSCSQRMLP